MQLDRSASGLTKYILNPRANGKRRPSLGLPHIHMVAAPRSCQGLSQEAAEVCRPFGPKQERSLNGTMRWGGSLPPQSPDFRTAPISPFQRLYWSGSSEGLDHMLCKRTSTALQSHYSLGLVLQEGTRNTYRVTWDSARAVALAAGCCMQGQMQCLKSPQYEFGNAGTQVTLG